MSLSHFLQTRLKRRFQPLETTPIFLYQTISEITEANTPAFVFQLTPYSNKIYLFIYMFVLFRVQLRMALDLFS